MFHLVPYTRLVAGKKYKIKTNCKEFTGICASSAVVHNYGLLFDKVKVGYDYGTILFSIHHQFYEFVTQNPQAKMERRAVTRIVRRVLGDDCFEW